MKLIYAAIVQRVVLEDVWVVEMIDEQITVSKTRWYHLVLLAIWGASVGDGVRL